MKKQLLLMVICLTVLFSSCDDAALAKIKMSGFKLASKAKGTPELTLKQKMNKKMSEMAEMAEIGTVEYSVTKVVKAEDNAKWYNIGDRKILFKCTAYLKAGIDLSEFDASKVQINETDKTVVITLPKAELLSFNMPPEMANLTYEKVSKTRFNFTAKDRNILLQQGEADIRKDVPNLGILQEAEKNASAFFRTMLGQMGFESVTVKFE